MPRFSLSHRLKSTDMTISASCCRKSDSRGLFTKRLFNTLIKMRMFSSRSSGVVRKTIENDKIPTTVNLLPGVVVAELNMKNISVPVFTQVLEKLSLTLSFEPLRPLQGNSEGSSESAFWFMARERCRIVSSHHPVSENGLITTYH